MTLNRIATLFLVSLFLLSCSSKLPLFAVPLQTSVSDEIKIAQLTQMLDSSKNDADMMMRIYIERGLIYDSLGLNSFSQSDFFNALNYNYQIPDIYNFLAIRALMESDIDSSLFYLNTALEIDSNYAFAYLNRGIVLYRTGHFYAAQKDVTEFYEQNKRNPISILWLYFIDKEIDAELASRMLRQRYNEIKDDKNYSVSFIAFYLGDINESRLMQNIQEGVVSNKQLAERLCETYFYLGKYYQYKGDNERAELLFKYALANNIYNFVEHQQALYEIKLLDLK